MKRLNILWIGLISVLMTACYDDYEKDYDKSSVYFASQKPLRTLVADMLLNPCYRRGNG